MAAAGPPPLAGSVPPFGGGAVLGLGATGGAPGPFGGFAPGPALAGVVGGMLAGGAPGAQAPGGLASLVGAMPGQMLQPQPPVPLGVPHRLMTNESGAWITTHLNPVLVYTLSLQAGHLLEVPTFTPHGAIDGTAIFEVRGTYPADGTGITVEVNFLGASSLYRAMELDQVFPDPMLGLVTGLLHICVTNRSSCSSVGSAAIAGGGRPLLHVDTLRIRDPKSVSEAWVRGTMPKPATPQGDGSKMPEEEFMAKLMSLRRSMDAGGLDDKDVSAALKGAVDDYERTKKKKRKKKRKKSSDDSSSESNQDGSLFRDASSSSKVAAIQQIAEQEEGRLYQKGMEEVGKFLGRRGGEKVSKAMVTYLISVFHGLHPPDKVGISRSRKMRTLAECLDALSEGNLPHLADLLMQRFKACEVAVSDGNWDQARHFEVAAGSSIGLASRAERSAAMKEQALKLKLEAAKDKKRKKDD